MNYITKLKLAKHKSLIATIIICSVSVLIMLIGYIVRFFELNRTLSIVLILSSTFTFVLSVIYYALFRAIANYYIMKLGVEK